MRTAIKISTIMLALLAGFFFQHFFASTEHSRPTLAKDKYCMLSTAPCTQHDVTMSLNSNTPHPLMPVLLTVEWPATTSSSLLLELTGLEMEMGKPVFQLKQLRPGVFQGEVIMPACTSSSMTWLGELSDGTQTVYPAIRTTR
ncbi:hypothetical protein [Vibrio marisflavi]|uniref:Uncharacterized protein n=1 Tax=Vibrio marisflavi CECT 7928 TaxID=634439 RepID=A0ABN8E240_9VIBR|nr:hypothetical protein [Vibrio marisflavi]CAH0537744.1 hypothetical protein VMF7928_01297 [Vibrio marisflavi CECT 7928]